MADREIDGEGRATRREGPMRARRPFMATEPILDPKRRRNKHQHAAPPGSDLERAKIAEAQRDMALEWVEGSACRDDCESWNIEPTACTCGRWHLLRWRSA